MGSNPHMHRDRFGQPITAQSARAVELYDDAIDCMFALQRGSGDLIDGALDLDSGFALGHCAKARSLAGVGDNAQARDYAARGRDLAANLPERERRHAEIVSLVFHGESTAALDAVRDHAAAYPRDAVPLSFALGVYGLFGFGGFKDFRERQVELLQTVAHAYGEDDWWFLASYGWALVEAGRSGEGIPMLDRALALRPDNANAAHGRAHGYYEQGAAQEGEAFIEAWLSGYDRRAILHAHLAWHQALFALQRGDGDRAQAIYRDSIRPAVSETLPMFTMVDCASFLLRASMVGCDFEAAQWDEVLRLIEERFPKPGIPFVNTHLAMVYGGVEDHEAMKNLEQGVARLLDEGKQASGSVVADICAGIAAYGKGGYRDAAQVIRRAVPELARLGGSNAQRDVYVDLAVSASLRAGDIAAAREIAKQRWTRRAGHLDDAWLDRQCGGENRVSATTAVAWRHRLLPQPKPP
ncbi:MAG: tetratricopeptide repeat protein [Gammaproteobacteria bacterium]|nr:tetratricopeptide repeat protein [Gammaproteobacteria bacterium]